MENQNKQSHDEITKQTKENRKYVKSLIQLG